MHERLGYGYSHRTGDWMPPAAPPLPLTAEADAMHGALMRRADALAGCQEGSGEEIELKGGSLVCSRPTRLSVGPLASIRLCRTEREGFYAA